jgi:signal transduction histidine kinase
MAANDPADRVYEGLRRLAATGDPRRARDELLRIMSVEPGLLPAVLDRASRAGEGRVRQVAASAARVDAAARSLLQGWLARWHAVEPDEFTKRALGSVLADDRAAPPPPVKAAAELPRDFADTYRYVTERVCHQVRNALAPADTELIRFERVVRTLSDPAAKAALTDILGSLQAGFDRASRAVEFDRGDGYMTWAAVDLADWLGRAAVGFAGRYGQASLVLRSKTPARPRVWAAPFLLDVVFGNLWANAVQKVGAGCEFVVEITTEDRTIDVLVRDSGPGFDDAARAAAFDSRYSTHPGNRGRGLLEIAEAVDRLHGRVAVVAVAGDGHRVSIRLPAGGP